MFGNRSLQLNFVKTPKKEEKETDETAQPVVQYSEAAQELVELLARHLIGGIVVYIAADTLRQVIVKSTPIR